MRNTTLPIHPTKRHPLTGKPLQAVGVIGDKVIWPILGGSQPIGAPAGGATPPPAAPPAATPPPAAPPAAPPGGATPPAPAAGGDPQLGPAGQNALQQERTFRTEAERRAKTAEDELAALKAAGQTDQERAIEAARAETRTEIATASNTRLVRAEVKAAAATAGFHNPIDAAEHLRDQLGSVPVTEAGDVDEKKVAELVAALATARPYLVKPGGATPPAPLPGQGNHQPAPVSGRDAGLAMAHKRFGTPKPPTS